MKIKLFVLAVASTFALGSQAATFQNSSLTGITLHLRQQ
jgi:hypothetical protein